jgi:hypothetical protein
VGLREIEKLLPRVPRTRHELFYPLGFALRVYSNSQEVFDAARAEWSAWKPAFPDPEIRVILTVDPTQSPRPVSPEFGAGRHNFLVRSDGQNFAMGTPSSGSAIAYLGYGAVEDAAWFQYHFLDAIVFHLITSAHLTPIHASCVARHGKATLLAGNSHAGKSSLAYACARRGWTYLSDDSCPLLRRCAGDGLVLGSPHSLRLRPDAPKLFPELAGFQPTMRGNGKSVLQIPTSSLPIETALTGCAARFVLLDRRDGPARLRPVHESRARELCAQHFYHWDPPVTAEQFAALDRMLRRVEVLSLEYSNLDEAVDLLE